jgi:hypothetical protein
MTQPKKQETEDRKPRRLTMKDYDTLLKMVEDPLTKDDCAAMCAPANDGIPFCCDVANAVPLLFKTERRLIAGRSDLWSTWKPRNKAEEKLLDDIPDDTVFCECKGVQHCERENRSLSCRTFPLEPYVDKRGVLVGLVFNAEFLGKCPLTTKHKMIPQETVDKHYEFWDYFTDIKEEEFDCYYENSQRLRRRRGQTKKPFHIFYPTMLKDQIPEIQKYI